MIRAQFLPWLFARAIATPPPAPAQHDADEPSGRRGDHCGQRRVPYPDRDAAYGVFRRRATKGDLEEQRKQLKETLEEQRSRTLNERFATAAGQLGSDKPPTVRLARVCAMAGLADDWKDNRQACVDVLCTHLRLPYEPDPGDKAGGSAQLDFRAGREVRHAVIRVFAAHLQDGAAESWQVLNFDFTDVVFDGGDFTRAKFSSGQVIFASARFSGGTVDFDGVEFSGG